jgi:hypothetical protein
MSQDLEKYLNFNVGLLKNSFALDALWQDALKYHMIDQPGKLIALRLTEYYEMMARGILPPGASTSIATTSTGTNNGGSIGGSAPVSFTGINGASPITDQEDDDHTDDESIVAASPDLEQNADEAAEYWARL